MVGFYTVERLGPQQELTPEGFLIIRGVPLARTGAQLYSERELPIKGDSQGKVTIYRDEDEVFRPETIASLNGKPIAIDHPDVDITPENYKDLAVGHVMYPRRGKHAMDNLLLGDLVITDLDAIKAIRSKQLREVSVGYTADYEEIGDAKGKQRNIKCNHLALVRDGRCGPVCRIHDSAVNIKTHDHCGGIYSVNDHTFDSFIKKAINDSNRTAVDIYKRFNDSTLPRKKRVHVHLHV